MFTNVNNLGKESKNKLIEEAYACNLRTYKQYFKAYNKNNWSFEKFKSKIENEYPLSIINKEKDILSLYLAISYPKLINENNYFKIGFWEFGKNIQKRKTLKEGINSLENKILNDYSNPIIFVELPSDFKPVLRVYDELDFKVCEDDSRTKTVLEEFGREILKINNGKYKTFNNPYFFHSMIYKEL